MSAIALGAAPGAHLAMFDVFKGSSASISDVLTAMNTAISDQATYNIVAINLSLGDGSSNASPCSSSPLASAVTAASNAGILTVAASGNSGSKSGLQRPACTPGVVSVGAVYNGSYGTGTWQAPADSGGTCTDTSVPDEVTCFSQSASYLTLLGPGTFVSAPSSAFQESGTSQATPHISGAVAVLRARYPAESLDETVQRMTVSGVRDTDAANGVATSRLNLLAAVNQGTALSLSGSGPQSAVTGRIPARLSTSSCSGLSRAPCTIAPRSAPIRPTPLPPAESCRLVRRLKTVTRRYPSGPTHCSGWDYSRLRSSAAAVAGELRIAWAWSQVVEPSSN